MIKLNLSKTPHPNNSEEVTSIDSWKVLENLIEKSDHILKRMIERRERLSDYAWLRDNLLKVDVVSNQKYRNKFQHFYTFYNENDELIRDKDWLDIFFSILQREKCNTDVSFSNVLCEIEGDTGRIETSFSSKLIATINPEMPVYDSQIRESLGLRNPSSFTRDERIEIAEEVYCELQEKTLEIISLDGFNELKRSFDEIFPEYRGFTDIKKLDLFLWQNRYGRIDSTNSR